MADQASVRQTNGERQQQASPGSMVGNIAEFGNDVVTLVELQAQLAAYDTKDCLGRATIPAVALAAGAVVALGTVPVILLGLADLIASAAQISVGATRLIVGLVTLGAAGAIGFLALRAVTSSLDSFRRTREELTRNVSWLRSVRVHSGRLAPRKRV